jgi:hypothetical protein
MTCGIAVTYSFEAGGHETIELLSVWCGIADNYFVSRRLCRNAHPVDPGLSGDQIATQDVCSSFLQQRYKRSIAPAGDAEEMSDAQEAL